MYIEPGSLEKSQLITLVSTKSDFYCSAHIFLCSKTQTLTLEKKRKTVLNGEEALEESFKQMNFLPLLHSATSHLVIIVRTQSIFQTLKEIDHSFDIVNRLMESSSALLIYEVMAEVNHGIVEYFNGHPLIKKIRGITKFQAHAAPSSTEL